MRVAGPGVSGPQRSEIDDAAVSGAQVGQRFAGNEKRAARVGVENIVPLFEGEAFERSRSEGAGVVDENVEAAELGDDSGDCSAYRGFGAHIARRGDSAAAESGDLRGGLRGLGMRFEISDCDVGAGMSQGEGDGATDAACSAGDKGDFTGERFGGCHRISLARERS